MLPTPAELREHARRLHQAAQKEPAPEIRRRLLSHALALAQFAEHLERDERIADFVVHENIERYRRILADAPEKDKPTVAALLSEEQMKLIVQEKAERLRMKAEECRAVAEQMTLPAAQASYRHLAESYEAMARHIEAMATEAEDKKPAAG